MDQRSESRRRCAGFLGRYVSGATPGGVLDRPWSGRIHFARYPADGILSFAKKILFPFRQIFTDALKATWHASKTKECLTGFALFLAPASAVAAINLFSGMGRDFHTSEQTVIWITGAGCGISTSLGALAGGYAANRISRGYLYLCAGLAASLFAIGWHSLRTRQPRSSLGC